MLRAAPAELGITCHVVGGSVRDRLARIIDIFGLPPGPHKVKIDLVDANHNVFPGQSKVVSFVMPDWKGHH